MFRSSSKAEARVDSLHKQLDWLLIRPFVEEVYGSPEQEIGTRDDSWNLSELWLKPAAVDVSRAAKHLTCDNAPFSELAWLALVGSRPSKRRMFVEGPFESLAQNHGAHDHHRTSNQGHQTSLSNLSNKQLFTRLHAIEVPIWGS